MIFKVGKEINKMKKILAILMALTLLASSLLVMTSCGDDGEGGNENGGSENGGENGGNEGGNGGNEGGDNTDGGSGEQDGKVEYKVTVKDQNGEAVEGVLVLVLDSASKPVNGAGAKTNADGELVLSLAEGSYTVMISGGAGYTVNPTDMMKPFGQDKIASFTVETEEKKEYLTYTVKVIDQFGAPVVGVALQACTESCIPFSNATDANGETSQQLEVTDAEYKVQLNFIPDGYSETDDDNDPTTPVKYSFNEDRVATVVITKN